MELLYTKKDDLFCFVSFGETRNYVTTRNI